MLETLYYTRYSLYERSYTPPATGTAAVAGPPPRAAPRRPGLPARASQTGCWSEDYEAKLYVVRRQSTAAHRTSFVRWVRGGACSSTEGGGSAATLLSSKSIKRLPSIC